jgi:hypothetical protein
MTAFAETDSHQTHPTLDDGSRQPRPAFGQPGFGLGAVRPSTASDVLGIEPPPGLKPPVEDSKPPPPPAQEWVPKSEPLPDRTKPWNNPGLAAQMETVATGGRFRR